MKKFTTLLLTAVLTVLVFAACGNSAPPVDLEGFQKKMEEGGYTVQEDPAAHTEGVCETAYVAFIPDKSNVDYYLMSNEQQAKSLFAQAKAQAEGYMDGESLKASTSTNFSHTASYKANSADMTFWVLRRENVVIYARAVSDQADAMKQLLTDMGF